MASPTKFGLAEEGEKRARMEFDPEEYVLRKRLPQRLPKRRNDVYMTLKTDFPYQLKKCKGLLSSGENEVFVHGLGAAVSRAINIALQLQKDSLDTLQLDVHTSTVDLTDDLEPLTDEGELQVRTRSNSAIHIRVFKKVLPPADTQKASTMKSEQSGSVKTTSA